MNGLVAQSVEQRTENPCVGGSIPSQATILLRIGISFNSSKEIQTMKKLSLIVVIFILAGCSTWNKDRVQNIQGINTLILSNDPKCKQLHESYTKLINDLLNLDKKMASNAALCSVNGPKNEVLSEITTDIKNLKDSNKGVIQKLKEKNDHVSFDSCFQTISASSFAVQKYGHVAFSYTALISNCSSEGKKAFENSKDPNEFMGKLEDLIGDLKL